MRYRIVDVFSDVPLAGNALCVVLDPVPGELMQRIARETNLSETTFPTVTGDGTYDNRIFTPASELPFAGHPTVGTAWVLGEGTWEQRTTGATVRVEVDAGGARMLQPQPVVAAIDPAPAAAALGVRVVGAWTADAAGNRHHVIATEDPIDDLHPDFDAIRAITGFTFGVVRRQDDANLHVRVFGPGQGFSEDPGTGSIAGPFGVIANASLGAGRSMTLHQGAEIGRPCTIEVSLTDDGPWVGGRVAAFASGEML